MDLGARMVDHKQVEALLPQRLGSWLHRGKRRLNFRDYQRRRTCGPPIQAWGSVSSDFPLDQRQDWSTL